MKKVPNVVSSIVVVYALTCCVLLYFVSNLKAEQINMLCSLIRELMFYEFELIIEVIIPQKQS